MQVDKQNVTITQSTGTVTQSTGTDVTVGESYAVNKDTTKWFIFCTYICSEKAVKNRA